MPIAGPATAGKPSAVGASVPSGTTEHVRGSSLLLVGRIFSFAFGFAAQVLMVRYLSKAEFGAFGFALSAVAFVQAFTMLEMSNVVVRFLPVYREHGDHGKLFGAIVIAIGVVAGAGMLSASAIISGITLFGIQPVTDPRSLQLLVVLALLIPLQGIDNLFTSLFAAFNSVRSIVLRQSILAPGLRLVTVLALIALGADVTILAAGYLLVAVIGVLASVCMFSRLLRSKGLIWQLRATRFSYPAREMFGFAIPLLGSTLVWAFMESSAVLLLGYFNTPQAVAEFRAVLPLAQVNLLVSGTFGTLYMPLAARLHARGDHAGLVDLYWQTALWMAVLSFPVYLVTFSFAPLVTSTLYGQTYAGSGPLLAMLAVAYFLQTSSGFNGLTLKVLGKLRYMVAIDVAAALVNLILGLALIPRWGALGAAASTAGTMILHNVLKQFGLWKHAGIVPFPNRNAALYALIFALPLVLAFHALDPRGVWFALPLGAAAILLALWMSREALQLTAIFPELERYAVIRAFVRTRRRS